MLCNHGKWTSGWLKDYKAGHKTWTPPQHLITYLSTDDRTLGAKRKQQVTAEYTINQSLEIIDTTLSSLTKSVQVLAKTESTMYDQGLPSVHQSLLTYRSPPFQPSPSSMTTTAILATPTNAINMNRSTSPATSRDTGEHDASPPHQRHSPDNGDGSAGGKGRALSTSKRAEQNRRAQRAFRERRDA